VRKPPNHGVTRCTLTAASTAPPIRLDNPTRQHRTIRFEPLTGHYETELVETAELGEVRASEGSVRHVEVFQMGSVGTPILGRPRPLPSDRPADDSRRGTYTLIWEEPL
jgi:hypothetical protein